MIGRRLLIVNADDFGQSAAVNLGVVRAHRQGIVTSASLMVRGTHAGEAAALARALPGLGMGLHVDLGEWRCHAGEWQAIYEVVSLDDAAAVAAEIDSQLERFRELVGRGPSHLDSHQHVHRKPVVRPIAAAVAARLDVPLRHSGRARYCGAFYGQDTYGTPLPEAIGAEALIRIVEALPEGLTELACHPAQGDDITGTMYRAERVRELEALCDPRVHEAIRRVGVELVTHAVSG